MVNLSLEEYSDLLGYLYDGAEEHSPWQQFLHKLNQLLDLRACYLFLRFPNLADDGLMFSSIREQANTPENPRTIYSEQFYASDPLVNLPLGEVVTIDDLVEESQLLASPFYQVCMEPNDLRHTAGIDLEFENQQRFSFRVARSAEQGNFSDGERCFLEMLASHLQRAVIAGEKMLRYDRERQLWENTLAGATIGMVMLDEAGAIVRSNAMAETYFGEKDGLARVNDKIQVSNTELNQQLKDYVKAALSDQRSGGNVPANALAVPRRSGKRAYEVVIKAIPIDPLIDPRGSPHLSVLICCPHEESDIDQLLLMKLYQLTPTQALVAIALGRGETLEQLAQNLGMKPNTARAHIRAIFSKMGVTQQTQLVSLVLKSLAAIP